MLGDLILKVKARLSAAPTVEPAELPRLFNMQLHAALSGLFFGGAWGLAFLYLYNESQIRIITNKAYAISIAIFCLVCFVITQSIASNNISDNNRKSISLGECGLRLRVCSILIVLGMGGLIIGSGGVKSPFMPLFIMTFTLTLENLSQHYSKSKFTLAYITVATVACLIEWRFPIIDKVAFSKISEEDFMLGSLTVGLLASFIVPAISAHFVTRRLRLGTTS